MTCILCKCHIRTNLGSGTLGLMTAAALQSNFAESSLAYLVTHQTLLTAAHTATTAIMRCTKDICLNTSQISSCVYLYAVKVLAYRCLHKGNTIKHALQGESRCGHDFGRNTASCLIAQIGNNWTRNQGKEG